MYRRIGLFALILATAITVNAGSAKAQGLAPSVAAGGVDNGLPGGKPVPHLVTPLTVNLQTAAACSICYTCGGDWPIFQGAVLTPSGGAAYERGGACSGNVGYATDRSPYLCCR